MLAVLLTATDVAKKAKKRVPSHVAPDLAADILREISLAMRQRKGDFPCYFLTDASTFVLPAGEWWLLVLPHMRSCLCATRCSVVVIFTVLHKS